MTTMACPREPGELQAVGPCGAGARTLHWLPRGGRARGMSMNFLRPSYADQMRPPESQAVGDAPPNAVASGIDLLALMRADRSCCCSARPAVIAVMPPTRGRQHHTDLLLCMHHYRAASQALAAAGASVVDTSGAVRERRPAGQPAS